MFLYRRLACCPDAIPASQILNLVIVVGDNAYVLAHPCNWFGAGPTAFGFLRDTCFNTSLALLHVMAQATQPWVDSTGGV